VPCKRAEKLDLPVSQIREALRTKGTPTSGKLGPATRYVNPVTGKALVIDNSTGEIFHVGEPGYLYNEY
jgi:hypothetical protein